MVSCSRPPRELCSWARIQIWVSHLPGLCSSHCFTPILIGSQERVERIWNESMENNYLTAQSYLGPRFCCCRWPYGRVYRTQPAAIFKWLAAAAGYLQEHRELAVRKMEKCQGEEEEWQEVDWVEGARILSPSRLPLNQDSIPILSSLPSPICCQKNN